jgi:uncharacterized protein (TIGR03083 family)
VPASPDWSVLDVVAHVTGVAGDVASGEELEELNLVEALVDPVQAARRETMTARQVSSRRGRTVDEVLAEWDATLKLLLPMMRGERPFPLPNPALEAIVTTDLAVHAQDVRGALGMPGDRESAAVGVALASYSQGLAYKIRFAGLPALRLRYGGKERMAGDGEPGAIVEADRFEIFRALAGRRSTGQIRAFDWTGDPEPYLPLIPAYGERTDALSE